MRSARPFITYLQMSRCISTSGVCSGVAREGRFMRKLISEGRKSKRKWYDADLRGASINPTDASPSASTQRRMMMRDKLFMEHITDMMSMGQVSDIVKGDVEITHVQITADFKHVNVYYIPNNYDTSVSQEALQKCARIIRHELSQLRVIGVVPPIQFVENKQYSMQREIDRRLAMINFEEASEVSLEPAQVDASGMGDADQTARKESTANCDSEADDFYTKLPMRHDVLGLDHHKIMSRIVIAVSKSRKAAQRRMSRDSDTVNECNNTDESPRDPISREAEFLTRKEQRQIFSDFLLKRQREERRRYKQLKKQEVGNNFEEEIDDDYEDNDIDEDSNDEYIDEYTDDFEDEARK
ncbi:PREDICTED: uncharacterized protein LOC105564265 [Vollenhovia emeryi]|uniref:uncharacterized protein LOC105564265 n=1 Tax=Vollenhovia emeryi TaxID=411798 RepID=UPI0005F4A191|nr:PREDICTED: uncharacterized protein LOC105564265 [Vollenhovia emeryi]